MSQVFGDEFGDELVTSDGDLIGVGQTTSVIDNAVAELLTDQFPIEPYDFYNIPVASAPGIGPIKAILATYQTLVTLYISAVLAFLQETTVQNATGVYLDAHGALYGVLRYPAESDPQYRSRILSQLSAGKNTIPAIQIAASQYESGLSIVSGGTPVTTLVYDQYSNPALVAQDVANGQPVPTFYFVVQLSLNLSVDDVAFADYCACDDEAYLFIGGTSYLNIGEADPGLLQALLKVRPANTIPIVKTVVLFDEALDPLNPPI